SFLVSLS
ncbi:hypothetical protein VCHENC02_1147B, partial [Vibrio harveyi]